MSYMADQKGGSIPGSAISPGEPKYEDFFQQQHIANPGVSDNSYMSTYASSSHPAYIMPHQQSFYGTMGTDSAWSTGSPGVSTVFPNYNTMDNYNMSSGMFGGFNYTPPAGFNWDFDYNSAWSRQDPTRVAAAAAHKPSMQQVNPAAMGLPPASSAYAATGNYYDRHLGAPTGDASSSMPQVSLATHPSAAAAPTSDHFYHMNGAPTESTDYDRGMVDLQHGMQTLMYSPPGGAADQNGHQAVQSAAPPPPEGPKSWASIASKPAKKTVPQITVAPQKRIPGLNDQQAWPGAKPAATTLSQQARAAPTAFGSSAATGKSRPGAVVKPYSASPDKAANANNSAAGEAKDAAAALKDPALAQLFSANKYNPDSFDTTPRGARYFVIKSYSEDDVHRSIKYSFWCSTEHGNRRLDQAFREREGKGPIYLFFSVNSSRHFCGMAMMMNKVDYDETANVWQMDDKWKGKFPVRWIYVKDVPNTALRHIRLENNENKPITHSRDTQEVPRAQGQQMLKILHTYKSSTSLFDDFQHYEQKQLEAGKAAVDVQRKDDK